MQLGERIKVKS